MKCGKRNLITDIDGLIVGNALDEKVKTGTTVLVCEWPMIASVAILGGAPGTRDVALLEPEQTVESVDALVLSGGSAFGLDAPGGAQSGLSNIARGFPVGPINVPIVPGAVLFDLLNGGDKDWGDISPYHALGRQAFEAASRDIRLGSAGAGYGATTPDGPGGLGSASQVLASGVSVGALVAVNSVGSAKIGTTAHYWAAPFELNDEFGGLGWPESLDPSMHALRIKGAAEPGQNTTIAIVATDAALTKAQCKRLAIMAHDGITRAIYPAHTPLDGDLVFAVSTGARPICDPVRDMIELGWAATATLARAIARGVHLADHQL